MADYSTYKFIHYLGLTLIIMALGAAHLQGLLGTGKSHTRRKLVGISHGVGMFLSLLGGFGMLAKLGIHWPWPSWVLAKFIIWIVLGALLPFAYRIKQPLIWWAMPVLVAVSGYLALTKPELW